MRLKSLKSRQMWNNWEIQSLKRLQFEWRELSIWLMADHSREKHKEVSIQIDQNTIFKLVLQMKLKKQRNQNMKIKLFRKSKDNLSKKEWYREETPESNKEILILHQLNLMQNYQKLNHIDLLLTLVRKSRYLIIRREELNEFEN